jgi:hypothetical protein
VKDGGIIISEALPQTDEAKPKSSAKGFFATEVTEDTEKS